MQRILSWAHQTIAVLVMAGLLVQVYLAGVGAFGASTYNFHIALGYMLGTPILLLLVLALAGRLGRLRIGFTVLLLALYAVQIALVEVRSSEPYLSALHAVNALALLGATASIIRVGPAMRRVETDPDLAGTRGRGS